MKSIRTRVMVIGFLTILIISNTLAGITYYSYKNLMLNEIINTLEYTAKDSSDYIGTLLNSQRMPLERMANSEAIKSMNWSLQKNYLLDQPLDYYLAPFVGDLTGNANYTSDDQMFLGDRDYYKTALSGTLNYSDVLISRMTNENVVIMASPIINRTNEVTGVLGVRLDLSKISKGINTNRWGDNGFAFILNEFGTIVSYENIPFEQTQPNLSALVSQDDTYNSLSDFVTQTSTASSGTGSFGLMESNKIVGFSNIPGTHWKLYVGAGETYIMRGINQIQSRFFMMTLIINFLAFIIAYRFTNLITKPVIDLDAAFQSAAQGDLSVRLTKRSNDEFGRASENFNNMMNVLKTLTYNDPITELPNLYVLQNNFKTSTSPNTASLMILAVDQFSRFNEQYGYKQGDATLLEISKIITEEMAQVGMCYRGKGDEFIIHFDAAIHPHLIEKFAQKLIVRLSMPLIVNDKPVYLKYSIGYDTLVNKKSTIDELLSNATHAKNISKTKGGNLITAYNKINHLETIRQHTLEDELLAAIEHKKFHMVYQPLYDLNTNEIVDIEALIRWSHPIHGFVSPDYFIDLAERLGHIVALDHWVIDAVFSQQIKWNEQQIVSINISAHTFESDDFITYIQSKIDAYGINPHKIQLELTERVLIKNIHATIEKLNALRDLGLKIALDDFGIGYSSLNYLVQLPLDSLKIDKSFINEITINPQKKMIVKTIIDMGHSLGLTTIAEGIENEETQVLLRSINCQIGQGYYFSKPIAPDQIYLLKH